VRRLLAAAVAIVCAAGCGGGAEQPDRHVERLSVATGGKGGIYALYGDAYARAISRRLSGYRGVTVETTGSVQNLLLLRDGRADIALTLADSALDAVEGREAFRRPVPARVLAQIYRSYVQVVAPAGSPIRTLQDLKGRRVSVGSPDSGTMVVAERLLALAKVDSHKDLARSELGIDESARALADGSIDAFFWSGGVPTVALRDLARRMPVRLLTLGGWNRELRRRFGGVYQDASIPPGAYEGVTAPIRTIAIPNYVVVPERMNEPLAFDLTRLLLSGDADLRAVNPEAGALGRAAAAQVIAPLQLHPGAQRYYDRSAP
jgi:TRAP transporter TAXI family solute receptor